ncbi:hypothetical protein [Massilimicrobiota timonensis]|uniref:hypothetical protein n=1 Tax=Massilimicrobiota timonensis TaxID=1776392 RepID=UPI00101D6858|nr:hypothetical protein [Massilimicrobiota timonensis]
MGYFLVVDKTVLKYSNDFDKVLNTLAEIYGGRLSIEYYGLITKSEILSMEYMDVHEGCYFFISSLELIDHENGTKKDIHIAIYHSGYLMEYVDSEEEDGYVIIDWLKANKERWWLDYSHSGIKKYCVMINENYICSYDLVEDACKFLMDDKTYSILKVFDETNLKDYLAHNLLDVKQNLSNDGYFEVIAKGCAQYNISIIELNTVFNHFHKANAKALAWYLDRDRSQYRVDIVDYQDSLTKACEMLVKMASCKDCYEFVEECPFHKGKEYLGKEVCQGECHSIEKWQEFFSSMRDK